jgi:hypothetical protein
VPLPIVATFVPNSGRQAILHFQQNAAKLDKRRDVSVFRVSDTEFPIRITAPSLDNECPGWSRFPAGSGQARGKFSQVALALAANTDISPHITAGAEVRFHDLCYTAALI